MSETIDDIVREMRKMGENYSKSESNDCRYVAYWLGTTFADRIEAAAKHQFRDLTKTIPHLREATKKEEVAVAENATTTPTCDKSSQVGNEPPMNINKINNYNEMVNAWNDYVWHRSNGRFTLDGFFVWLFDKVKGE